MYRLQRNAKNSSPSVIETAAAGLEAGCHRQILYVCKRRYLPDRELNIRDEPDIDVQLARPFVRSPGGAGPLRCARNLVATIR